MSQQDLVPAEPVNAPTKRDIAAARMSYDGARAFASQVAIDRLGSLIETPEGRTKAAIAVNAIAEAVAMGLKGPQSQHWLSLNCGALRNAVANILDSGLSPVGAAKELYVYPKDERLHVALSPAGIYKLSARAGQILRPGTVRKGDALHYELNNAGPVFAHRPVLFSDEPIVGVYLAVYRASDDRLLRVVTMSAADVNVNRSKSKMKNGGPWADYYESMAAKAVLHRGLSSGAFVFEEGIKHALAAVPLAAYEGDEDEVDLDAPTVRQVAAPDAPRAFQRPAPPVEDVADPASGGGE